MDIADNQFTDEELTAWLGFSALSGAGIGINTLIAIYNQMETLVPAWEGTRMVLERMSLFTPKMIDKFLEKRKAIKSSQLLKTVRDLGIQAYPYFHSQYPYQLREIHDPPCVLYVKGDLGGDAFNHTVGIVGTRRPTAYGQRITKEIAGNLASAGALIVSGMAIGIDSFAHRAAIEAGGKTVAVVASGVDQCYPSSNKPLYEMLASGKHGAVVSEYFPGTTPDKWRFPARNRIVSGLSKALVVVEAGEKSGALITADLAFQQNRDVFSVPGRIDNPAAAGTNKLIKVTKAQILTDYKDVFGSLKWVPKQTEDKIPILVELYGREKEVWDLLSNEPVHFDTLVEKTGIPVGELSATLTMLELSGVASRSIGDWYTRESPRP